MPDVLKTNNEKKKNEAKEQRKPRGSRHAQSGKAGKKVEELNTMIKVPQKPPVYEDPGPEFYKGLKRETEEILKITEEENSKYKKKEIQSNWSKYEMPIESYEEIEEQDVGADYEKLIQAPLLIGGHFQFKHEKSWDTNTAPSLYDKYFDINMDRLSLAVTTIPFYERNCIDTSLFSDSDMLTMNNRATKYKQKYYNDKSYSTPETEAYDKILNAASLSDNEDGTEVNRDAKRYLGNETKVTEDNSSQYNLNKLNVDITSNSSSSVNRFDKSNEIKRNKQKDENIVLDDGTDNMPVSIAAPNIRQNIELLLENINDLHIPNQSSNTVIASQSSERIPDISVKNKQDNPVETTNISMETTEDLEKWLDDFLGD